MEAKNAKRNVCVVTGAGKGLGKETAKLFYQNGYSLALISRHMSDFKLLQKECMFEDSRVLFFEGDVSKEAEAVSFIKKTASKFKKIDVLINNAGMRFRKPFLKITTKEWNSVISNNLSSMYFLLREAGKFMVKRKAGSIVNIASIVGTLGLPDLCAYGASKGGVIALTKCLALEWARFNIRVNAVAPGFCETSYTEKFKKNKGLYKFTIDRIPLKKWGDAVDVAKACLFLASEDSKYITGETLSVDGGWSAW